MLSKGGCSNASVDIDGVEKILYQNVGNERIEKKVKYNEEELAHIDGKKLFLKT